ncbi:MAG: aminomethyl-transferring glycine dehydrogenase subunit GcvPA [Micropruina sp.]|uniref:aminomethyl-transferring glycine dehydrogenase subunit GcvPA n=1 Tax=Micropruina sp. TaxID=2737536 RepID=UPI0039E4CE12
MTEPRVHPYIPNTAPAAKAAMLAATGAASVEDFYADIPDDLRLHRPLDLPPALVAEEDLRRHVAGLLARNESSDRRLMFLGGGTYPHAVPAVVTEVINRGEFLTAYAGEPYEDHGRFQALFEYASEMAELLQTDVVTIPTYDGFQATSTALAMCARITGRSTVLLVSDADADKLSRVTDFLAAVQVRRVPTRDAVADLDAVAAALGEEGGDDVAAVWVETPSATGAVEQALPRLAELAHAAGALLVVGTDPVVYGIVEPPATQGADLTCGDIQSLGLGSWFGGAHAGFLACADDPRLVMELPSRLFGLTTTDVPGELGFGDVAYERTSFAVREEGKEWVGTAAALWGIAAGVYLALMGPQGMRELGETLALRTRYAQQKLAAIEGVELADDAFHLREFVISTPIPAAELVGRCRQRHVEPGIVRGPSELTVCVTELHSKAEIDRLAAVVESALTAPNTVVVNQENLR